MWDPRKLEKKYRRALAAGAVAGGLLYSTYYFKRVAKAPHIVASGAHLQQLVGSCPSLNRPYFPTFWAINNHIQTCFRSVPRKPAPSLVTPRMCSPTLDHKL